MLRFFLFFTNLLLVTTLFAQGTLMGTVTDEQGEPLPEAAVLIVESGEGITTDSDGFFNFGRMDAGTYTIQVSYLGYETWEQQTTVQGATDLEITLKSTSYGVEQVEVWGTWANAETPVTKSSISKETLEEQNLGQDLPYLLRWSPSVVVTSDAGAGVGYTGIRVRGSDASRTNVTINGIPVNDSESQGVFWVNMPDFASSVENIQIQRGVGTSTNGAGAFGATVNLSTSKQYREAYVDFNNSYGSFDTWKNTLRFGTGLIKNQFTLDGRLSRIKSDGYIDRGRSDLNSWYVAGGWYKEKTVLKAIAFSGKEKTYQAWNGVPEARFKNDLEGLKKHYSNNSGTYGTREDSLNLFNSGRSYNYYRYDNQVDDYQQNHYQLHLTQDLGNRLQLKSALHWTQGEGFFEEYKAGEDFKDYGLPNLEIGGTTIESTDLIRRRWLDNDYYGGLAQLQYTDQSLNATFGTAYHHYDGDHFGEIIWTQYAGNTDIRHRWYNGNGVKKDFNAFAKASYRLSSQFSIFADLQARIIDYTVDGTDNDLRALKVDTTLIFFNPKMGVNYRHDDQLRFYFSAAIGNREPVRNDFVDAAPGTAPKHESMLDLELGTEYHLSEALQFGANLYWMQYKDQLIPTGAVNDVGSPVRTNVDDSYRAGIELQMDWTIIPQLKWQWNTTLSRNKIKSFTDLVIDYGNDVIVATQQEDTDIAFSPNVIVGSRLSYQPLKGLTATLQSKYIGKQYLDNNQDDSRSLAAYFVNDLLLSYQVPLKELRHLGLTLGVYNLFDEVYASNGYTYSYIWGDKVTENFVYPQAGTNIMVGVQLGF